MRFFPQFSRSITPKEPVFKPAKVPPRRDFAPGIAPKQTKIGTHCELVEMKQPRAHAQRMYKGAEVDRTTADWPITLQSANAEILVSAIGLRSRMRELERDDDHYRSMLGLLEDNVVGHAGFRLGLKLKDAKGKYRTDEIIKVREAWQKYMQPKNASANRIQMGVEIQRMAIRRLAVDGALPFRIHRGFANDFAFAIEPKECDYLDFWYNRARVGSTPEVQFGIEADEYHAPIGYWMLTRHPGDVFAAEAGPKYRYRLPSSDVIPFWTTERAGQYIGMPLWPSVGWALNHLKRYKESELIQSRVAACKGGWFEETLDGPGQFTGAKDSFGNMMEDLQPGQWRSLPPGLKAVQYDPTHPVDAFGDFVKANLRGAASGANLPYNSVANDLEGVNYSSIRAGLLDARNRFKWLQMLEICKLMQPWFEAWVPFAILSGQLDMPLTSVSEICDAARWGGVRWPWVDPLKDVQADVLAVQNGFTSPQRVVAENEEGGDIEEIYAEIAADKELAESHGLMFAVEKGVSNSVDDTPEDAKENTNG